MTYVSIKENVVRLLKELPEGVMLVAAAKMRTPGEVREAVEAGVKAVGENYVQEAMAAYRVVGKEARWHFIGHLQKNKVKKAVEIFDMIETVDSLSLAEEIDKRCRALSKVMPVLIEVNSAGEARKFGVMPDQVRRLAEGISVLANIKLVGLMTMGPLSDDSSLVRPPFARTRKVFEELKEPAIKNVEMKYLSMGMTGSYRIAIEEGANIVRVGTKIFGERK